MESNNNMPMPNANNDSDVSANISSPLSGDAGTSEPASSESNLNIPSHDEGKPEIISPDNDVANKVNAPVSRVRGIEVIATRKGFYNQHRKAVGDEFKIRSEEEFGEWFVCKDPRMEKARQKFIENKKARQQEEKARRK